MAEVWDSVLPEDFCDSGQFTLPVWASATQPCCYKIRSLDWEIGGFSKYLEFCASENDIMETIGITEHLRKKLLEKETAHQIQCPPHDALLFLCCSDLVLVFMLC